VPNIYLALTFLIHSIVLFAAMMPGRKRLIVVGETIIFASLYSLKKRVLSCFRNAGITVIIVSTIIVRIIVLIRISFNYNTIIWSYDRIRSFT